MPGNNMLEPTTGLGFNWGIGEMPPPGTVVGTGFIMGSLCPVVGGESSSVLL